MNTEFSVSEILKKTGEHCETPEPPPPPFVSFFAIYKISFKKIPPQKIEIRRRICTVQAAYVCMYIRRETEAGTCFFFRLFLILLFNKNFTLIKDSAEKGICICRCRCRCRCTVCKTNV